MRQIELQIFIVSKLIGKRGNLKGYVYKNL